MLQYNGIGVFLPMPMSTCHPFPTITWQGAANSAMDMVHWTDLDLGAMDASGAGSNGCQMGSPMACTYVAKKVDGGGHSHNSMDFDTVKLINLTHCT